MAENENDDYVTINGRRYPSRYPPGVDVNLDRAWEIVDSITDLPDLTRAFLAGQIAGTIIRARQEERENLEKLNADLVN